MKATGMTRPINQLGRVVIPREIIKSLGWKLLEPKTGEGDRVEFFIDGKVLMLKKYNPGCMFCGELSNLKEYMDNKICADCIDKLSNK